MELIAKQFEALRRSAQSLAKELERLQYNQYHPQYKRLLSMTREHWDHNSTQVIQRIYLLEPERAQALADRKLRELEQEERQIRGLLQASADLDDREVYRAWILDIQQYQMLVLAALPGGIAC